MVGTYVQAEGMEGNRMVEVGEIASKNQESPREVEEQKIPQEVEEREIPQAGEEQGTLAEGEAKTQQDNLAVEGSLGAGERDSPGEAVAIEHEVEREVVEVVGEREGPY